MNVWCIQTYPNIKIFTVAVPICTRLWIGNKDWFLRYTVRSFVYEIIRFGWHCNDVGLCLGYVIHSGGIHDCRFSGRWFWWWLRENCWKSYICELLRCGTKVCAEKIVQKLMRFEYAREQNLLLRKYYLNCRPVCFFLWQTICELSISAPSDVVCSVGQMVSVAKDKG